MNTAVALMLVAQLATPPASPDAPVVIHVVPPSRLLVGLAAEPHDLQPGAHIFNQAAYDATNAELKRLQVIEANPPKAEPDVRGWMLGCGIVASVFTTLGLAVGFALGRQGQTPPTIPLPPTHP